MFAGSIFAGLPKASVSVPTNEFNGTHVIELVEDRANEITIPAIKTTTNILTRLMVWDDALNTFVAAAQPTRISEYCKQLNKRYLGSSALVPSVVMRCEAVDADTGNRLVFTPGATVVGSSHDFEVIIPDQLGGYESRGFTLFLTPDANPSPGIDAGAVLLRLTPVALPW
jgi:hypothetical protein